MTRDVTPDPHPSPAGSRTAAAGGRLVTVHSDRVRRSQPVEMTPSMAYALVRNPRRLENREPLRIRAAVTALSELNDPNPTVIRRVRLGEAPPVEPARATEPPSRTGPRPTKPGEVRPHVDRTTYRTLPRPGGRDAAVVAQIFGLLDSDAPVRRPAAAAPDAPATTPPPAAAATPPASSPLAMPVPAAGAPARAASPSPTGADGGGSPGAGAPAARHRPAPTAPAAPGPDESQPAAEGADTPSTAATDSRDAAKTPEPAHPAGASEDAGSAAADARTSTAAVTATEEGSAPAPPKLRWWQRLFGRRQPKGCQMCGWRGEGPCPLGHR